MNMLKHAADYGIKVSGVQHDFGRLLNAAVV